jgi:uncharacterized protein YbbC (DUF1343 family)
MSATSINSQQINTAKSAAANIIKKNEVKPVVKNQKAGTLPLLKKDDRTAPTSPPLILGVENKSDRLLTNLFKKNLKPSVGLVTNQTGKDQEGNRSIDILIGKGINVKRIFVPEHGLDGSIPAEKEVHDSADAITKIPIVSLYGHGTGKKIPGHKIKDLDCLMFDIQDSGMRHYTYVSTLMHIVEAAGNAQKPLIVFDRPNPLGALMEGPLPEEIGKSFIAMPIPLRHGMTMGELAQFFNAYVVKKKAQLYIVKMQNYTRNDARAITLPLSPNIKTKMACCGYSFLGILGEVRPFDIGLGTNFAMECLSLPEQINSDENQWLVLKDLLTNLGLKSKLVRYYSERKKQYCKGLQFLMNDASNISSFKVMLTVLKHFNDAKIPLTFSKHFDVAIGTKKVREYLKDKISYTHLTADINKQTTQFFNKYRNAFIYKPLPKVNQLL